MPSGVQYTILLRYFETTARRKRGPRIFRLRIVVYTYTKSRKLWLGQTFFAGPITGRRSMPSNVEYTILLRYFESTARRKRGPGIFRFRIVVYTYTKSKKIMARANLFRGPNNRPPIHALWRSLIDWKHIYIVDILYLHFYSISLILKTWIYWNIRKKISRRDRDETETSLEVSWSPIKNGSLVQNIDIIVYYYQETIFTLALWR